MIELPEATVIARQITETLSGKLVERAVANASPHKFAWYSGDPAEYNARLAGKVIGQGSAMGGSIEFGAGDLFAWEVDGLFEAVRQVLGEMTRQGGRDTEKDLFGQPGGYRTVLSKNTVDGTCPACGSFVCREPYLGGAIYYCPGCQRL
jgi:formamidopyrimidine-DNA glycosylase